MAAAAPVDQSDQYLNSLGSPPKPAAAPSGEDRYLDAIGPPPKPATAPRAVQPSPAPPAAAPPTLPQVTPGMVQATPQLQPPGTQPPAAPPIVEKGSAARYTYDAAQPKPTAPAAPAAKPGMGELRRQEQDESRFYGGMQYPEEQKAHAPSRMEEFIDKVAQSPVGKVLKGAAGFLPYSGLFADDSQAADALRMGMMEAHVYPQLPDIPPGMDRKVGIGQKNGVIAILKSLGEAVDDQGVFHKQPTAVHLPGEIDSSLMSVATAIRAAQHLTPWQKQLMPIVRQQLAAETRIRGALGGPKLLNALFVDTPALLAGVGAHGWAREALINRFGPVLERPVLQTLMAAGPRVAPIAARGAGEIVAGTVGGAAAGAVGGGAGGLLQGQRLPQAAQSMLKGAVTGAKIGGLLSAFGFGSEVVKSGLYRGYNLAEASALADQAAQVARSRGYAPDEVEGIRQRVHDFLRAPAFAKPGLARDLAERLNYNEARNVSPEPPGALPPGRGAGVPPEAARPAITGGVTGTFESRVPATRGPIVPQPDGSALNLRLMTPEQLQRAQADAVGRGDTQAAARFGQWLSLHESHVAHQHPDIPIENREHFVNERHKPGSKPMAVERQMTAMAKRVQTEDPELAALLHGAASAAAADFQREYYKPNVETAAHPLPIKQGHPMASAWRRMTDEQKAKLPAAVRESLIVQDISNSLQVEYPAHAGIHRLSEVPGRPRTAAAAEKIADAEFAKAQETMATRHPAPEAQPAPMPVEAPTAPPETPQAQPAPTLLPEPQTAPEPVAAAPAEQPIALRSAAGTLQERLDEAHGHIVRQRDVSLLRPSELRGYLGRIDAVLREFDRSETRDEIEGLKGKERVEGDLTVIKRYLDAARKALDAGDNRGVLLAGEQALNTLHVLGYRPIINPLSEIAGSTVPGPTAPEPQPKSKGRILPFAKEWAGMPAEEKPAPVEQKPTHEQTRAEFLESTKATRTSSTGVQKAPVASAGKPGIRIEKSTVRNPEAGERVVVFRDKNGNAQGTLHFTAPGEAMGVNKMASVLGVYVEPGFRGQGIASQMYDTLEKAGYELPPVPDRVMTLDGAQLYHARAVRKALENGSVVPENVLADYPKLKQQIAEGRLPGGTIDAETGLGNKAAWDSTERGKAIGVVKVAHAEAPPEALAAAAGDALRQAGLGDTAFAVGPGEFRVTGDDPAALKKALDVVKADLASHQVVSGTEGAHPQGIEASYGIGTTEAEAERAVVRQPAAAGVEKGAAAEARPAGTGGKPGGAAGAGRKPTPAGGAGRERGGGAAGAGRAGGQPGAANRPARGAARGEPQPGDQARAAGAARPPAAEKPGAVTPKQQFFQEFEAASQRSDETPTVKGNRKSVGEATNGKPVEITGFRSDTPAGRVPGTGTFYAMDPFSAGRYALSREGATLQTVYTGGDRSRLAVNAVRMENPLVIEGGHKDLIRGTEPTKWGSRELAAELAHLPENYRKAIQSAWKLVQQRGEPGYALLDKAIAQAARAAGHDGIIYRHRDLMESEIVDLRSVKAAGVVEKPIPSGFRPGMLRPLATTEEEKWRTGNPKFDAFQEKNYGVAATPPEGTVQRIGKVLTRGFQLFTRGFADLPETGENKVVKEFLLDRRTQAARAKLAAEESIYADIHDLTPGEHYQLSTAFTAKNMAENLEWQRGLWEEAGNDPAEFQPVLRGDMTEADVKAAAAAVDELLKTNPKIKAAVDRVFESRKDILDPWFAEHQAVKGYQPFDPSEKQWYMRQMIVAYANGEALEAAGGRAAGMGKIPGKPSIAMQRQLSTLDYDTHFIESEVDWRAQAIRHTWNLQFVRHLEENMDITPQVKLAAAFLNSPEMEVEIQSTAKGGPLSARFLDGMGRLARKDMLPDRLDGRFAETIAELHRWHSENEERVANSQSSLPISPEMWSAAQDYAGWLEEQKGKYGKLPAKMPDTHTTWDLTKMPAYYWGSSVNARLVEEGMNQAMTDLNVPMGKIRKALMVGRRQTVTIPKEVAHSMETEGMLRQDAADAWYKQLTGGATSAWKLDKLYAPAHFMGFLTKKLVMDNVNILRYAPKAMVDLGRGRMSILGGMRETAAQYWGSVPSADLRKFDAMGGETGLMQAEERVGGTGYNPLRRYETGRTVPAAGPLARAAGAVRKLTAPLSVAGRILRLPIAVLEKTARYGVHKYYLDYYRENGHFPNMGVSKPEQINALVKAGKIEEAAFNLSAGVVSDYRARTQGTRWLRRYLYPFASIKEIILHQNIQSFRNAWNDPDIAISTGRKLMGEAAGWSPAAQRGSTRAWALGRWAAGFAGSLYALQAINEQLHHKENQALHKLLGNRPYLITGSADPKTGAIPYHDNMSGAGELLDQFFDYGNWGFLRDDVMAGRKSFGQAVAEASIENWQKEALSELGPQFRIPLELAGQRLTQRGVQPERDPYETMLDEVDPSFAAFYRQMRREPLPRGFWRKWATGSSTIDPSETTYYKAQDDVRNWLRRQGHPGESAGVTLAGDAVRDDLYQHKLSKRLGDSHSAAYFLHLMRKDIIREADLDPKKPIKQLDQRVQRAYEAIDPLRDLKKTQLIPFLKAMSGPKNRDVQLRVRAAYRYYATLTAPITAGRLGKWERLPFPKYVMTLRQEIKNEIKNENLLTRDMTNQEKQEFERAHSRAAAAQKF